MAATNWCAFVALFCAVLFVTFVVSAAQDKEDPLLKHRKACYKELGIDDKDPSETDVPEEKSEGCVYKKSGLLTADGKFALDLYVKMIKDGIPDKKTQDKAITMATACEKEINSGQTSEEQTIVKMIECLDKLDLAILKIYRMESSAAVLSPTRKECYKELGIDENSSGDEAVEDKIQTCIFKKAGIIKPDGKFALDVFEKNIKSQVKDEKKQNKMIKLATECEKEVNGGDKSNEDRASLLLDCFDRIDLALIKGNYQ